MQCELLLLWYCTNMQYTEQASQSYNGTPLKWSPMGQNKLTVLTRFFLQENVMAILLGGKKSGHNDEVTVRQSFTVRSALYEYRCT